MIEIYFNNEKICIEPTTSLEQLLKIRGYDHHYFAVAVNRVFIPKKNYYQTAINHHDIIDIITPMQGG